MYDDDLKFSSGRGHRIAIFDRSAVKTTYSRFSVVRELKNWLSCLVHTDQHAESLLCMIPQTKIQSQSTTL